jgi:hypothetical protein
MAARRLSVQDAVRAAAAGIPGPGPDIPASPGAVSGPGSALGWLAGHKPLVAAGAVAMAAAIIPAEVLGGAGPQAAPQATAAPSRTAHAGPPAQLLAQGHSWSARARHQLTVIEAQLTAMRRVRQELGSAPDGLRTGRARTLHAQLLRRIDLLERQWANLSVGLAVWQRYQTSAKGLGRIHDELVLLRGAGSQPAGAAPALAAGLAHDQRVLAGQRHGYTVYLRHTVTQPVVSTAAAQTQDLVRRARGVLPSAVAVVAGPTAPHQPPGQAVPAAATPVSQTPAGPPPAVVAAATPTSQTPGGPAPAAPVAAPPASQGSTAPAPAQPGPATPRPAQPRPAQPPPAQPPPAQPASSGSAPAGASAPAPPPAPASTGTAPASAGSTAATAIRGMADRAAARDAAKIVNALGASGASRQPTRAQGTARDARAGRIAHRVLRWARSNGW